MVSWPEGIKRKARYLRKKGFSYSKLSSKMGIARSTLFEWVKDIRIPGYDPALEKLKHIERIQTLAVSAIKKEREERLKKIKEKVIREVGKYNLKSIGYLESLLAMLYWTEGAKTRGTLIFTNTDPQLAKLYITLLRQHPKFDERKLRIRLHLHHYHPVRKTRRFWSHLLCVPESQFGKIYIKPRSKTKRFRRNFAGICFIKYHSENLRYEMLERASQITKRLVPVAQLD